MGVTFVLGPAGAGKTTAIQREIAELSRREPQQRILYLVPEQMTLSAQRTLLNLHPDHGVMNTEILSFNRLAHRIFEETGMLQEKLLDDMGKSMILYKIACDHADELRYYQASVRQRGFIGQLKIMLTELYQYQIGDEELRQLAEAQPPDSILRAKWEDIRKIRQYFEAYTADTMLSSEQVLDVLAERIQRSRLIAESRIYLDDFSGFTPQQYRVLAGLIRRARSLTVCLSMTPAAWKQAEGTADWKELPANLFHETQKTVLKLQSLAREARVPYQLRWCQQPGQPALEALRNGLFRAGGGRYEGPQNQVFAQTMETPAVELDWLLHEILHLVREEGLRYREIAVVAGDMERYAHALRRRLALYGMPGYIDSKSEFLLNPYAQLIVQSLKAAWNGGSYDTVFSLIKTGLTPLTPEQADEFENEALRQNWRGLPRYVQELRERANWPQAQVLAEALDRFREKSPAGSHLVRERLQALRELLDNLALAQRMEEKSQELQKEGKLLEAMEYHRLPQAVEEVLNRMEEALGGVSMDAREFSGVMDLGLEQCRLGTLPPSLDQLIFGDMERTRLEGVRVLFVIGFQDGCFPKGESAPGLLTRREREVCGAIAEMPPMDREDQQLQYLQLYTLLGKASERIYFSCCTGDGKGKLQSPSLLWRRLQGLMEVKRWPDRSRELTRPLAYLMEQSRAMAPEAIEWYQGNGYRKMLQKLKRAEKEAVPLEYLTRETVGELLDLEGRSVSVTQLEQYVRCPFSYFLRYGLRLKEREMPQVSRLDDGNVLHEILEEAGEWFRALWGEGADRSEEELREYVARLCENKKEEYSVYQTTGRYRYYWRRLQETAGYAVRILSEQLAAGQFKPEAFEWSFGRGKSRPVEIPLSDGTVIRLQGKIDRVDILRRADGDYLRIIDYKSGKTSYSESDVYAGLQLQLPIYMEAALESGTLTGTGKGRPAGIFYFHLTPMLQKGTNGLGEQEKSRLLQKQGRLEGLLLEDRVIAESMDCGLADEPRVLRAALTKSGAFRSSDRTATAGQFRQLGQFARGKVAEAAEKIRSGQMEARPVESGQRLPCTYCTFRGACRFDERLPGAETGCVEELKPGEFWKRLEEEIKKEGTLE